MKNLILIAAIGKYGELGKNNDLIWKIKEDMSFFRKTTIGHSIVMGRNTFESLPKLLPNRTHIVLTQSNIIFPEEVVRCFSIEQFFEYAKSINDDIFVIGGASIYKQFINVADKMILTEIQEQCENADVYFPTIDYNKWECETIGEYYENQPKYLRKIYSRK